MPFGRGRDLSRHGRANEDTNDEPRECMVEPLHVSHCTVSKADDAAIHVFVADDRSLRHACASNYSPRSKTRKTCASGSSSDIGKAGAPYDTQPTGNYALPIPEDDTDFGDVTWQGDSGVSLGLDRSEVRATEGRRVQRPRSLPDGHELSRNFQPQTADTGITLASTHDCASKGPLIGTQATEPSSTYGNNIITPNQRHSHFPPAKPRPASQRGKVESINFRRCPHRNRPQHTVR